MSAVFCTTPSGSKRIANSLAGCGSPLSVISTRICYAYIRSAMAFCFADWPNCCAIAFMSCDCADAGPASRTYSPASTAE